MSPWSYDVSTVGTIVASGMGEGCAYGDGHLGCEASFMELDTSQGALTVGLCVPGGFTPPPVGSTVAVDINLGGEFCEEYNELATVRDESGNLLLHLVSNYDLRLPELGTVERVPICSVPGQERAERHVAFDLTIGSETGRVAAGGTLQIGGYSVTVYAAGEYIECELSGECDTAFDAVVVRPIAAP